MTFSAGVQLLAFPPHSEKIPVVGPLNLEFVCSPRVAVGFVRVFRFPPTVQKHALYCIGSLVTLNVFIRDYINPMLRLCVISFQTFFLYVAEFINDAQAHESHGVYFHIILSHYSLFTGSRKPFQHHGVNKMRF